MIEPTPEDFNLDWAHKVLAAALEGAQDVILLLDRDRWETLDLAELVRADVVAELAGFTRQIRERATPQVLAQQLVIKKHRSSAELTRPEEIALTAFTSTLLALDDFAAAERKRLDAEKAAAIEPVPTPIEDTILEAVGDGMETY